MTTEEDRLMTAAQVRAFFGGISDMTLWRWLHTPEMDFPQPIRIQRLRYWRASEIEAFAERHAEAV